MDYSPRGHKESDTAERLSTHVLSTHSMHALHLLSKLSSGSWLRPSFTPEWGPPSFLLSWGPTHITSSAGRCQRLLRCACSFSK